MLLQHQPQPHQPITVRYIVKADDQLLIDGIPAVVVKAGESVTVKFKNFKRVYPASVFMSKICIGRIQRRRT